MTVGYGQSAYGTSPWGAGLSSSGLLTCVALNPRQVRVTSTFIEAVNPTLPGDPLNPESWQIVARDPGLAEPLVALVETEGEVEWLLTLQADLTADGRYRVVTTATDGCDTCDFRARSAPEDQPSTLQGLQLQNAIFDVANPQLVRDAAIIDPPPLGTYQLNDRGDFATDTRLQGVRKRIFRRLGTPRDGFFHLPGYGFSPRLKGTITQRQLRALALEAQAQVLREPEVVSARVSVALLDPANNVVSIKISARTTFGLDLEASQPIALRGGA